MFCKLQKWYLTQELVYFTVFVHVHNNSTGQFMGTTVQIDQQAGLMKFDDHVPFAIKKGEIWSYLNTPGTCWYPTDTDDQGRGILEGVYTDYIVDDLFAINFRYNHFKY